MRKLQFDYKMEINYSQPVHACHFTIRGIPMETAGQHVGHYDIEIEPAHTSSDGVDSFGNRMIYGTVRDAHSRFVYRISGEVELDASKKETESLEGIYRYRHPHGLNRPGEKLRSYYESLRPEMDKLADDYGKAEFLMHCLHRDFVYEPAVTDVNTDAEHAWVLGRGVCQDYTHIFIALSHLAGIPARYAAGLIEGEGASHAWAEVFCGDRWCGLDPTNDLVVTDGHIKIGHGRDAADCQINRGVIKGFGSQKQDISVSVYEIGEKA